MLIPQTEQRACMVSFQYPCVSQLVLIVKLRGKPMPSEDDALLLCHGDEVMLSYSGFMSLCRDITDEDVDNVGGEDRLVFWREDTLAQHVDAEFIAAVDPLKKFLIHTPEEPSILSVGSKFTLADTAGRLLQFDEASMTMAAVTEAPQETDVNQIVWFCIEATSQGMDVSAPAIIENTTLMGQTLLDEAKSTDIRVHDGVAPHGSIVEDGRSASEHKLISGGVAISFLHPPILHASQSVDITPNTFEVVSHSEFQRSTSLPEHSVAVRLSAVCETANETAMDEIPAGIESGDTTPPLVLQPGQHLVTFGVGSLGVILKRNAEGQVFVNGITPGTQAEDMDVQVSTCEL
jgi:hypothetical protein